MHHHPDFEAVERHRPRRLQQRALAICLQSASIHRVYPSQESYARHRPSQASTRPRQHNIRHSSPSCPLCMNNVRLSRTSSAPKVILRALAGSGKKFTTECGRGGGGSGEGSSGGGHCDDHRKRQRLSCAQSIRCRKWRHLSPSVRQSGRPPPALQSSRHGLPFPNPLYPPCSVCLRQPQSAPPPSLTTS